MVYELFKKVETPTWESAGCVGNSETKKGVENVHSTGTQTL